MGSLCGGNTQTTTSQSSTTPTNVAGLQDVFNKVQSAASNPYTPYTGQLTAGVNSQQQQGIANVNANANTAQPYYQTAADYARTGAAPISASAIQGYENPYTKSVIDATQANFNESNGQQQQQVKGNLALSGALGGSRQGVAQAETARLQKLAQDPVIAGLNQSNYTQALAAAQADRSAAGNAAGTFGNLGTAAQTAGLQGAGAQIGAGTLQQGTDQAALDAQYKQYLQAQAFPYAQAQFYSQYGTPAALAQGSSTAGSQTTPGPNPLTQALGLGTAALTAFSDERVKEGKEVIGKTFDGQPIYKFRYVGSPMTQIGLMAQDVEHRHPGAVGESNGIKTVDYDQATRQAAERGHFAAGGPVSESPFNFIANGVDFIPKGAGAPSGQLNAPALQFAKIPSEDSSAGIGKLIGAAGKTFGGSGNGSGGWGATSTGAEGVGSLGGLYADGGLVEAIHHIHKTIKRSRGGSVGGSPFQTFADGGDVFGDENRAIAYDLLRKQDGTQAPGSISGGEPSPVINPDEPYRMPPPEDVDAWRKGANNPALVADASAPQSAPQGAPAPANPMQSAALPPQIKGPQQPEEEPSSAMAFDSTGNSPMSLAPTAQPANGAPGPAPAAAPASSGFGGFNPFGLSDKARGAIIAGALGVAASRSPFALSAIGEGGLKGLGAYNDSTTAEREAADKKISQAQNQRRVDMEAQRIAQSASQFAKTNSLAERKFKSDEETGKFVSAGSIVSGDTIHPAVMDQRTGKIIDAVTGKPPAPDDKVEAKGTKAPISDEDAKDIAKRYVDTGDRTHLQGLGMTGSNKAKVNHFISEYQKEQGLSNQDLGTRVAEWEGRKAGQRTLGTQEAKMGSAAFEAEGAIKQARGIIEKLPRTSFLPINKLIEGYQNNTLNPDQTELYGRTQAIVNTYAAVMARGANVTTDSSRHHAQELLKTAGDPATYNRMLDTMLNEIEMAKKSPERMREFYRQQYGGKAVEGAANEPSSSTAPADVPAVPKGVPPGSKYSRSRNQWSPDGGKTLYNADGSKA